MRAIVQHRYGLPREVLALEEVDVPTAGEGEVLLRVAASSVNALDWHMVTGTPYVMRPTTGLRRPKRATPGADVAGVVEAAGPGASRFSVGDEVFGECPGGGFAEWVAVPETHLARKPDGVDFEAAAAVPVAGLTALQSIRDWGRLQRGQRVLINGASGGVGTFAVQVAKALGAGEVVAVCSGRNVEMVRSLGADRVIDYETEDFAASGDRYDLMVDNVGTRSLADCRSVLTDRGSYSMVSGPKKSQLFGPVARLVRGLVVFGLSRQRAGFGVATPVPDDVELLGEWLATGAIRSVIERTVSLDEAVMVVQQQGDGRARAKSVVTV